MSTLQVLMGARDRLANGWCQHVLVRRPLGGGMQFCAVGAILDVTGEKVFDTKRRLTNAAVAVLEAQLVGDKCKWDDGRAFDDESNRRWTRVVNFNNYPFTHGSDVLALFDRAIASLQPAKAVIAQAQNTDLITDEITEEVSA